MMKAKCLTVLVILLALVLPFSLFAGAGAGERGAAKPVELIWIMGNPGQVPLDQAMVEEAMDKISVEKLGVKVTTLYYDNDRTMLALSAGEDWDMVFTCEWFNNFAVQARAGYFADITSMVKQDTPALYATMPEIVWEGAKIDGKIMAIPVKKDYAAELFFRFDKALFVDKLGMNPPQLPADMTFADVEKYLAAAKKAYEDGVLGPEGRFALNMTKGGFPGIDALYDMVNRDTLLGIPYSAVGTKDANKIVVTAEHQDMFDRLVLLNKWFKAGYINRDAATVDQVPAYSPVKVGQGFYGADAIWTGADGYVQVISRFSGPFLSTASIRGSMNSISRDSDYIALALKYQELVNTNQEYRDILRYGIEGVHWKLTPQGLAERLEAGRQRYQPWPFSQGSYSLSRVQAAEGVAVDPKMWEVIFDGYKNLKATNTIGFSFDIGPVETEVAAVKVIREKYWSVLTTGTLDPRVEGPKLLGELEAAGLRRIQAEAQRQFDAFLAKK